MGARAFHGPHFGYVDVPHVQITRPRKEAYSGTCLAHVAKSAGSRGPTHTFTKHPWMAGQVIDQREGAMKASFNY